MNRVIRPTVLSSLVLPGFIGAPFAALAVAVIVSGKATLDALLCLVFAVGVCALLCLHFRRRITIVTDKGVAVRNMFGCLRRLSWSEISRSKVIRCTRESAGSRTYAIGSPGSIHVLSQHSRQPALKIPVTAYREEDIQFLLERLEFKYDYDYDPRPRR